MRAAAPVRVFAAMLLALVSTGLPASARAEPSEAELARNEQAVILGERGLAAFGAEDFPRAYAAFHAAESLVHSPVFLLYMARARARQGSRAEALDLYVRVENEPVTEQTPEAWVAAVAQARREALELRRSARPEKVPPARQAPIVATSVAPPPRVPPNTRGFELSPAAITAGAVGAAGLALGTTAGLVAHYRLNSLKERCGGTVCNESQRDELESIGDWGTVADVAFVVAAAGLGTSAVMIWVVPGPTPAAPRSAFSVSTRFDF